MKAIFGRKFEYFNYSVSPRAVKAPTAISWESAGPSRSDGAATECVMQSAAALNKRYMAFEAFSWVL